MSSNRKLREERDDLLELIANNDAARMRLIRSKKNIEADLAEAEAKNSVLSSINQQLLAQQSDDKNTIDQLVKKNKALEQQLIHFGSQKLLSDCALICAERNRVAYLSAERAWLVDLLEKYQKNDDDDAPNAKRQC